MTAPTDPTTGAAADHDAPHRRGLPAYTLAHIMTTWGVAFDANTLGGDTASGTNRVYVYVNGEAATPDVKLADGDNVVIAYGTPDGFPKLPPADALEGA